MAKRGTNPETVLALQELCREKGGLLHPQDVVDAARSKASPLHKYFEWDDDTAADKWRLEQARGLLQTVFVKVERPDGKVGVVEMFVSLTTDRKEGGYRTMVDVLSDSDLRNQMIRDAMADMQLFTERYRSLRELAGVFAAVRRARKRLEKVA